MDRSRQLDFCGKSRHGASDKNRIDLKFMRWLLLDEIIKIEKGKVAETRSHVPHCEFSPEPLLIEMMAQTAGLLLGLENDYEKDLIFAKIESAEFKGPFNSGNSLWIEATSEALKPEGAWLECVIQTNGEEVARARLLLMSVERLLPEQKKSITFHETFMSRFQVLSKVQ